MFSTVKSNSIKQPASRAEYVCMQTFADQAVKISLRLFVVGTWVELLLFPLNSLNHIFIDFSVHFAFKKLLEEVESPSHVAIWFF